MRRRFDELWEYGFQLGNVGLFFLGYTTYVYRGKMLMQNLWNVVWREDGFGDCDPGVADPLLQLDHRGHPGNISHAATPGKVSQITNVEFTVGPNWESRNFVKKKSVPFFTKIHYCTSDNHMPP